jgi:hypothetical protein
MNTRFWIPLCTAALICACGQKQEEDASSGEVSVETVPSETTAPGDQTTTPGGTAGETGATPPGTQPETVNPPQESAPAPGG